MLESILISISICVILPIAIVSIISYTRINSDNQRTQVLLKAIEANNNIDADKLAESLRKPVKVRSPREVLNFRLLNGCIFSFLGLGIVLAGVYLFCTTPDNSEKLQFLLYLIAAVAFAIGFGNLVVYFVTRKQVD